jgi:hypothetical protein
MHNTFSPPKILKCHPSFFKKNDGESRQQRLSKCLVMECKQGNGRRRRWRKAFFGRPRNGRGEEIAGEDPLQTKLEKSRLFGGKFTGEE